MDKSLRAMADGNKHFVKLIFNDKPKTKILEIYEKYSNVIFDL